MGISSLVANMLQQLTKMREEVIYEVFLYLRNSYNVLDQERCLKIWEESELTFKAYVQPLAMVSSFLYLGRTTTNCHSLGTFVSQDVHGHAYHESLVGRGRTR